MREFDLPERTDNWRAPDRPVSAPPVGVGLEEYDKGDEPMPQHPDTRARIEHLRALKREAARERRARPQEGPSAYAHWRSNATAGHANPSASAPPLEPLLDPFQDNDRITHKDVMHRKGFVSAVMHELFTHVQL